MKYTLLKIYSDGRIDVSFDIDNKVQNLDNAPLTDQSFTDDAGNTINTSAKDALDRFLTDYGNAYEAGLIYQDQPVIAVDPDITKIIGKPQEAVAPVEPPTEEVISA